MSIQIELKPEIEAELKARARKNGLPLSLYVQRILEQHMPGQPVESAMTPEERAKAFQDWAESFPYRPVCLFPTTPSAGKPSIDRITNRDSWSTSPTPTSCSAVATKPTPCT